MLTAMVANSVEFFAATAWTDTPISQKLVDRLPDLSQDDFYHGFKLQFCQKSYDLDHSSLYISDSLLHKKLSHVLF